MIKFKWQREGEQFQDGFFLVINEKGGILAFQLNPGNVADVSIVN